MNRKLKVTGLALVATLAMSAVAVSAASAAGELFNSTAEPTTLDGSAVGSQDFETTAGVVECKKITFQSTMLKKTASEIKVVPTYTECEFLVGEYPARVTMTSCYYVFTSSIPAGKKHAPFHVECTSAGDEIDIEYEDGIKWRQCIDIPAQAPTNGTTYASNGKHLDMTATVTGMKYTLTGTCGSGMQEGGGYAGKITVKGTDKDKNEATLTWK